MKTFYEIHYAEDETNQVREAETAESVRDLLRQIPRGWVNAIYFFEKKEAVGGFTWSGRPVSAQFGISTPNG